MNIIRLKYLSVILLVSMIAGCNKSDVDDAILYDNTKEVETYYAENAERFVFSTPDQLSNELVWQDGAELPLFADPEAKRGGQINFRLSSMQQTLRVVGPDANGSLRGPLWDSNTVSLVERHPWADGFIPGIASHWAIDPNDNRTVYLRLDPDARWSDGKQITVDDLFFSMYFMLSPHINMPALNRFIEDSFSRITQFDEQTFSITQTRASSDILANISGFILFQKEFYKEFGADYVDRYHWRFAPVTGAYVVDESKVDRGRKITFDRVDNWWADKKPFYQHRFNPDKMTYFLIREDNKALASFLKGDVDWHPLNETTLWYDYANSASIQNGYIERAWIYNKLPAGSGGIHLNAMHPPFTDINLRLGIQHAINYDRVNESLYRGDRRRIKSFADGYDEYSHPTLKARSYDLEKAKEYFAKAGYIQRGDDGVLINDQNQRLSFVLSVANRADEPSQATILKEEALKAGLELIIDALDGTSHFTKLYDKQHQMVIGGWSTGYSPIPTFDWELRGEDAGKVSNFNTTNIKDEQLDALLVEWDTLSETKAKQAISHKVQQGVHDFAAWIPGLVADYTRLGYWRWVKWPEYFQGPRAGLIESGLFWIDQDVKRETIEARKMNNTFPPVTTVYDRWKQADND